MRPDGSFGCDRCDADVGNGGVDVALVVSDLDPDLRGHVRNLHFCRSREEGEGDARTTVEGCAGKVLTSETLAAYRKRQGGDHD